MPAYSRSHANQSWSRRRDEGHAVRQLGGSRHLDALGADLDVETASVGRRNGVYRDAVLAVVAEPGATVTCRWGASARTVNRYAPASSRRGSPPDLNAGFWASTAGCWSSTASHLYTVGNNREI